MAFNGYQRSREFIARRDGEALPDAGGDSPRGGGGRRGVVPDARRESYTIQTTGQVECAFAHLQIISALVYVHGAVTAGVPAASAGDCYLGRVSGLLSETRLAGDATPYVIDETPRSELQPGRIYVRGTAGDIVTIIYRPE